MRKLLSRDGVIGDEFRPTSRWSRRSRRNTTKRKYRSWDASLRGARPISAPTNTRRACWPAHREWGANNGRPAMNLSCRAPAGALPPARFGRRRRHPRGDSRGGEWSWCRDGDGRSNGVERVSAPASVRRKAHLVAAPKTERTRRRARFRRGRRASDCASTGRTPTGCARELRAHTPLIASIAIFPRSTGRSIRLALIF